MGSVGERVKQARLKRGLTLEQLAERVGVKYQSVQGLEDGKSRQTKHLLAYARALSVPAEWLERNEGDMEPESIAPQTDYANQLGKYPALPMVAPGDKIPVRKSPGGEIVGHVSRPPFLTDVPNAYAAYVHDTTMAPRYLAGETIYLNPGKPVTADSYVFLQPKAKNGEQPPALIRHLVKITPTKYVLEQFNPSKTADVLIEDVAAIHRIIASGE